VAGTLSEVAAWRVTPRRVHGTYPRIARHRICGGLILTTHSEIATADRGRRVRAEAVSACGVREFVSKKHDVTITGGGQRMKPGRMKLSYYSSREEIIGVRVDSKKI
jgi:hypothetical protein